MKVIITGGAGFIASNLTRRLLDRGVKVIAIDNFFLGKKNYIEPFLINSNYEFVEQDLLDLSLTTQLFLKHKPDRVWHLAANSDISLGAKYTDFDLNGGTLVTYNVLESMRLCQCSEILFSSSGAVYGEPNIHPTPENYGPMFPISLYAASKLACEGLVSAYAHNFNIKSWIFRFGNIVGPNPTHGVISDFVGRLFDDPTRLIILGDGTQAKPYLHVEDCLDGMEFAHIHSDNILNYFNLAVHNRTTVSQIAEWVLNKMGISKTLCSIEFTGGHRGWRGDVPYVNLDTSKINRLGWMPILDSNLAVQKAILEISDQLLKQRKL